MRALLVGRFQPPHKGHLFAIRRAIQHHRRVIVAVGSAQHSHEPDNPFTVGERFELLTAAIAEARLRDVHMYPLPDLHRHGDWVRHVESLLPAFDVVVTNNPVTRRLFQAAGHRVEAGPLWRRPDCSGRAIRARWTDGQDADALLPPSVAAGVLRMGGPERVRALAPEVGHGRRRAP